MKRNFVLVTLCTVALLSASTVFAQKKDKKGDNLLSTTQDSISYIIGQDIGGNFKKNAIDINVDAFLKGLTEALKGNDSLISEARKIAIMTKFQQELQTKQQANMTKEAETNKAAGKAFLDANLKKDGVKQTTSGLQYKVIKEGSGVKPLATSKVTVNYEGKLIDGKIFDSSYERGQTATFPLNGVIKGWTEGLQLMTPGSIYEFYIPSDLAYGDRGNQAIPGGSTLIFKVELIKVE
jgi:FKBP-type peptidyl-prolyl cis-trans isomerase